MTASRASAQKTDMQRLVVHVETRQNDPVPKQTNDLHRPNAKTLGHY